jgi:hypothetical protein
MRAVASFAFAALAASALAADAPVVTNSPGAHYIATLPAGGNQVAKLPSFRRLFLLILMFSGRRR